MRRFIRACAWFAIAAQPLFIAAWATAGALEPHYSATHSSISSLAATGMRHPAIVMAGMIVLGLGLAALAPGLRAVVPSRPATRVAAVLFVAAGVGFVVTGVARLDCDISQTACRARLDASQLSWHTSLHVWVSLAAQLAILATPFALARSLWPRPPAALALAAGTTGIGVGAAAWIAYGAGGSDGIVERLQLLPLHLWVVFVAAGILYETRPAPRWSRPAPLRPRDFFGSAWAGEGVGLGVPAFVWRPIAPRFRLTRETTWHSDEVAVVRDRAVLTNGHVEERVRFARFVDPTHIHVTADDMPDGADVTIDEHGYRIAPYRVRAAIGPARFTLRARDRAAVDPDGTLRYVTRLRWLGLPVARLEMRARPVDTAPPATARRAPAPSPR